MAAPRKANPYASAAEMMAAVDAAGSIKQAATSEGVAVETFRRWADDLGAVDLSRGGERSGRRGKKPGREVLERLSDAELEGVLSLLGAQRAGAVLGISASLVIQEAKKRSVDPSLAPASPRAAMLERRVKDLERQASGLEEIMAEIRRAANVAPAVPAPALDRSIRKHRGKRSPVDVVLHVSDLQYGEVVHDDVPGGAYSPEILEEERLPRWLEAVSALLENAASANPIRRVWVAQGGDFVEGVGIFAGQEWHLGLDAGEQVLRLGRVWASALARVAKVASACGASTAVVGVVGNHGVHGGRKAGAVPPTMSYDHLTYQMTRAALQALPNQGGVAWFDAEARRAVYFQTLGGVVLLTHGDQDRGGGLVGAPVVTGLKNDLQVRLSTGVDHALHILGHYHRPTSITVGGDRLKVWNGAWVGSNNLSIGRGGASLPSQNVHVMHEEWGLIATHRVRLTQGIVEGSVEILAC